ncbi:MAG: hypothetical protein Q8934_18425 [Bacillota bacterium]|nr:hypothetical protein [Bacillota bacterium]
MKKLYIMLITILIIISIIFLVTLVKNSTNPRLDGKEAPSPKIALNGKRIEHKYESFCWNQDCSQMKHTPPSLPATAVKGDDMIEITWDTFKEKPNRVILHNITTGETITYHLTDSDIELDVPKQANPFQYEVIFQWYKGASNDLRGESFLSFKVKAS